MPRARKPRAKAAKAAPPATKMKVFLGGKVRWVDRPANPDGDVRPPEAPEAPTTAVVKKRAKAEKPRISPEFLAKARELRDRWMEAVADGRLQLADDASAPGRAKYDVSRQLPGAARQIAA